MAISKELSGYDCEFVNKVPEDYYCKQCKHVAREPKLTYCCQKCFCEACIGSLKKDSCPLCYKRLKTESSLNYKEKIQSLVVYCSNRQEGCNWTGQLLYLEAHEHNDCVYDQIKCDKCFKDVKKRSMDTHLTNKCSEREYGCKYCNFKGTYRVVTEHHLNECTFLLLDCPYRCGATFRRSEIQAHVKLCAKDVVQCEFNYAGCNAEFTRDKQNEHAEQNTHKHLAMMAAVLKKQQQLLDLSQATASGEEQFRIDRGQEGLIREDQRTRKHQEEMHQTLHQRLDELEDRMRERNEQLEEMMGEREQQIRRELQDQFRLVPAENPDPENRPRHEVPAEHRPWSCSMVLSILASILLAVMIGIHMQVDDLSDKAPTEPEGAPDYQLRLEGLQCDIKELRLSIEKLQVPNEREEKSHDLRMINLEEQINNLEQFLRESLEEMASNLTQQYSREQATISENLDKRNQDFDVKLRELNTIVTTHQQATDQKIQGLTLTIGSVSNLGERVTVMEQKMTDLSSRLTLLEQRLEDLKLTVTNIQEHRRHHHGGGGRGGCRHRH